MFKTTRQILVIASAGFWLTPVALAQAPAQYVEHDFLTDYSLLKPFADGVADYAYVSPTAFKDLANYDALIVDQPEVFISPDSDYKGAKPDNLKAIADLMRSSLATRLEEGGFNIVQAAGPGVLYLRFALADLQLIKKKRGLTAYSPTGFIAHATVQGLTKDLAKKVRIDYLTIELELTDSMTGEVLFAGLISKGREEEDEKSEIVQWDVFEAFLQNLGRRIECRLSNAKLPESDWEDCVAIRAELTQELRKRGLF
jgi:hypothetical protein